AGRCAMHGGVRADRLANCGIARDLVSARVAGSEMLLELERAGTLELLVEIAVQTAADVAAIHGHDSWLARCSECSRSLRARARRDITVPSGMAATAAISL